MGVSASCPALALSERPSPANLKCSISTTRSGSVAAGSAAIPTLSFSSLRRE